MSYEATGQALQSLLWWRLPLLLRNTRNQYARQHPLFIIRAILLEGRKHQDRKSQTGYLFHPVGSPLSDRINKGHDYRIDVVFPSATEDEVRSFLDNLRRYLHHADHNFELVGDPSPEYRSLDILRNEFESVPALQQARDLCLDFLTPLDFPARDPARSWLIDTRQLVDLGAVHLKALFPSLPWPLQFDTTGIELLPYYWHKAEPIRHKSRSGGGFEFIEGMIGPLYVKGDWAKLLPLLLVGSELHTGWMRGDEKTMLGQLKAGYRPASPKGAYRLCGDLSYFDRRIRDPGLYRRAMEDIDEDTAAREELAQQLEGPEEMSRALADSIAENRYRPRPAKLFELEKSTPGSFRVIAQLHGHDMAVHRALYNLLSPVFNRMFEHASVGFRPGLSTDTARKRVEAAIRKGAGFAVRADVENFFDDLDWSHLDALLMRVMPAADSKTLDMIRLCIGMPAENRGQPVVRTKGVLQGSPLSPLLANLYLDTFDEQLAERGYHLTRYGDDFVILTESLEKAEKALQDANDILQPLGLRLNPDKTDVSALDLGFSFLGMDLSPTLDSETVARSAFRKSLFIQEAYAFAGIDHQSVVIRRRDEVLARLPIHRLAEIVFMGHGSVSTGLIQACARLRIPLSFCSPGGWYHCTLRPDSRAWFGLVARHERRHEELGEGGRLEQARFVVEAKLRNYAHWLHARPGPAAKVVRAELLDMVKRLSKATSLEMVRGHEGSAAKLTFPFINHLVLSNEFRSDKRVPREKPDRYNTLLDMLYSLLFTRFNVLLRSAGLNPYLGFLHSAQDQYESLVCDLQEPFRYRMDNLAVKLINLKQLTADSFEKNEGGKWRLTSPAAGIVIEAFEKEEKTTITGDASSFGQLIAGQVSAIRAWVEGATEKPRYFVAGKHGPLPDKHGKTQDP